MTETLGSDELVAKLLQPEVYPWAPATVELIETHISWVFLAGERVVKVKRPVQFPFVDHRTLEQRKASCEAEVRLNRRLTRGVYLAAVPVTMEGDALQFGGEGEPVEWVTLMRRLPANRMLDHLLTDAAPPDLARTLAGELVSFHLHRAVVCARDADSGAAAQTRVVTDNLAEMRRFGGELLSTALLELVSKAMQGFVTDHGPLLLERVTAGWIRDGHGDLRCEHICLEPDGRLQVFDCVEFNAAIRCADVASDLAYLLVDLERFGEADTAASLTALYRRAGVDLPDPLLGFYRGHRALVRAKIDCLAISEGGAQRHEDLRPNAALSLDLAARAVLRCGPVLIVMTGLSATGKSTAAAALGRSLTARVIVSDQIRKELTGNTGQPAGVWESGIYAPGWTDLTYRAMGEQARMELRAGRPVILDATFLTSHRREEVRVLAEAEGVPLMLVETLCDESEIRRRMAHRESGAPTVSDARWETYVRQRQRQREEPPIVPEGALAVTVVSGQGDPNWLDSCYRALVAAGIYGSAFRSGSA